MYKRSSKKTISGFSRLKSLFFSLPIKNVKNPPCIITTWGLIANHFLYNFCSVKSITSPYLIITGTPIIALILL